MEIVSSDANLPVPYMRRINRVAETTRYVARPGLRALPSGAGAFVAFGSLQFFPLVILLWAIWWPAPRSTSDYEFAIGCSVALAALVVGVFTLLARQNPGFLLAVMRSPFISIIVTDRRVLWTLPWMQQPLMDIGHERILGGVLGQLDRKGNGPAALVLVPGDPCADMDGNIHFDRLPDAAAFVAALRG
ncbi:hypothetical protein [Sphingomonas sp. MMS24-J13]|uniref:hypothetical protein n=1 Tax=Sphingomonas sp. MMS24-J13 TaxID=3238686 RepID=UPI00384B31B9